MLLGVWQDVLVVTAPGSGAEVIPFLKTWVNLPMAIGFTIMYAKVRDATPSSMAFVGLPLNRFLEDWDPGELCGCHLLPKSRGGQCVSTDQGCGARQAEQCSWRLLVVEEVGV